MQNTISDVADLFFKGKLLLESPVDKRDFLEYFINIKNYSRNPEPLIFEQHYSDYLEVFNWCTNNKNIKRRYFNSPNKLLKYWYVNNTNINYYLCRGYSIEESKYLLKSRQSTMNSDISKKIQNTILSKSEEEIKRINKSKGNGNRFEFYLDKINEETGKLYTEEEAKNKIKKKQSKSFINRWKKIKSGEIPYFSNTSINYYLDKGLSFEDSKKALIERQRTFTLEKCITKYGIKEGIEKFKNRQKKWQDTLNSKSDEEKESIKRLQYSRLSKYSKASYDFFSEVLNNIELLDDKIHFGEDEYVLYDKEKSRVFFYDFVIPKYNICIEYNGLTFHPHPELTENERIMWIEPFSKMTFDEKTEFDNYKNNLIIDKGYDLLVIWENDEEKNQKAINFIKSKKQLHDNRTN